MYHFKRHKSKDLNAKEYIDNIKNVLMSTSFTSKRVGVDEFTGIYYNDNDNKENTSYKLGIIHKYILGINTLYNIPRGLVVYHVSSAILYDFLIIENMITNNLIPLQLTNIENKSYKVKRSNGDIQDCRLQYNGSLLLNNVGNILIKTLYFNDKRFAIISDFNEKCDKYFYGDCYKFIPLKTFLELNNLNEITINLPYINVDNDDEFKTKYEHIDSRKISIYKELAMYYNSKLSDLKLQLDNCCDDLNINVKHIK